MNTEERVRVAVRVRPLAASNGNGNGSGNEEEAIVVRPESPETLFVFTDAARQRAASFRCETFLAPAASQSDVFEQLQVAELVEAALAGFPVTIFAYGQTGAGKSFTIFGKDDTGASASTTTNGEPKPSGTVVKDSDGLLPRAAAHLMAVSAARRREVAYTLRVTCVEIYNEQVRDVFDPRKEALSVRTSKEHGVYLENATVVECATARELVRVVKSAQRKRAKSSHLLNASSNRSHCLVTIYIDAEPVGDTSAAAGQGKKYGKLTIVDLAGSERATDTGVAGAQLRETGHINKSLSCLNQVIQALNSKDKAKFVPYRDSKLTMLLLDSLGGNSKTLMVACVNGAPQFATESVRTLEFAMGVAKIKNRPAAVLNPHEKLIQALREQIRLLKLENEMLRARTPGYFVEHPEHDDVPHTGRSSIHEAADPPVRTLPGSDRLAEALRFAGQQQSEARGHHVKSNGRRASTGDTMKSGLQLLKTKHPRRPQDRPVKKKAAKKTKPPAVKDNNTALPPVWCTPMAAVAPLGRSPSPPPGYDELFQPQVSAAPPPPDYDELFGIETVPVTHAVAASRSVASIKPPPPAAHRGGVVRPPPPRQDAWAAAGTATAPPSDQLQQLLAQMLEPPAAAPKPEASKLGQQGGGASSSSGIPAPTPQQWDDDRAHDLFLQLCRL